MRIRVLARPFAAPVAILAAAGFMAACSSSGGNANSGSANNGAKPAIQVATILTTSSPSFGFPEEADGMNAYLDEINSQGGVAGHRVVLSVCNNGASAATAAACALKAAQHKSVAVLGGIEINGPQVESVLGQAKIPYVNNPVQPADSSSPIAWNVSGGSQSEFAGLGLAFVKDDHCTKIDVIAGDEPTAKNFVGDLRRGAAAAAGPGGGAGINHVYYHPAANADFAPIAAQVARDGSDCVAFDDDLNSVAQAVPAVIAAAPKIKLGGTAPTLPATFIQHLGKSADGILISDTAYPPTSSEPGVARFRSAMAKYYPKAPTSAFAEAGWGTAAVLVQALRKISGDITSSAVTKALGSLSKADPGGIGPTFNMTIAPKSKAFARLFNSKSYVYTAEQGKFVNLPLGKIAIFDTLSVVADG